MKSWFGSASSGASVCSCADGDDSSWPGRCRLDVEDRDEAASSVDKRLAEEDLVQVAPTECLRLVSLALMREARSEAMMARTGVSASACM